VAPLALITMFQFVEDLSDRQAADAVRARSDWKYALGLDLDNPGFDHAVVSEFRSRLIDGDAERLLFDLMLERFRKLGLLKAHGRQRTDSSHVLAAVRARNRLLDGQAGDPDEVVRRLEATFRAVRQLKRVLRNTRPPD
jgi:transposase